MTSKEIVKLLYLMIFFLDISGAPYQFFNRKEFEKQIENERIHEISTETGIDLASQKEGLSNRLQRILYPEKTLMTSQLWDLQSTTSAIYSESSDDYRKQMLGGPGGGGEEKTGGDETKPTTAKTTKGRRYSLDCSHNYLKTHYSCLYQSSCKLGELTDEEHKKMCSAALGCAAANAKWKNDQAEGKATQLPHNACLKCYEEHKDTNFCKKRLRQCKKSNMFGKPECFFYKPDCLDPALKKHPECLNCTNPDTDPLCRNVKCLKKGKDRGLDICENFEPDCTKKTEKEEDACINCKAQKSHSACQGVDCSPKGKDRNKDICKKYMPNCTLVEDKDEDLCIDCKESGNEEKDQCKDKDCSADGANVNDAICYYSTTTTTEETLSMTHTLDDDVPHEANDSNIYLDAALKRGDYLTEVTVPTFLFISIFCACIFLITHMPKCCFGLFREPDWDTYGKHSTPATSSEDFLQPKNRPSLDEVDEG